jgi:hypothetical protein
MKKYHFSWSLFYDPLLSLRPCCCRLLFFSLRYYHPSPLYSVPTHHSTSTHQHNPKPQTPNPKPQPQTTNHKPQTTNHKPQTTPLHPHTTSTSHHFTPLHTTSHHSPPLHPTPPHSTSLHSPPHPTHMKIRTSCWTQLWLCAFARFVLISLTR